MVYFYGKLIQLKQMKIDPEQKGKNMLINIKKSGYCLLDFGFEGYSPTETLGSNNIISNIATKYVENIYDKLKSKLVEGEYLYLYYYLYNEEAEVNYTSININNPKNEYTFMVIQNSSSNSEEKKTLIINNYHMSSINYQIYFCKSPHSVHMYYQDSNLDFEILYQFDNKTMIMEKSLSMTPFKLRFESEEDFVFSYSFFDKTDSIINTYQEWNDERKELSELHIKEIIKKYPREKNSNIFSIKFYPNYKYSSTRYIVVIASKDINNTKTINNTKESFSNPCYLTKLVTEKIEGVKIFETVDIGENDLISIDADFSDIESDSSEYILNIISQEIRFNKKINFYEPYEFFYNKSIPDEEESDDENDDKDKKFPLTYIIIISIGGLIILLIIIFIIIRYCKKNNNNNNIDFNRETKTLTNEKLLDEL